MIYPNTCHSKPCSRMTVFTRLTLVCSCLSLLACMPRAETKPPESVKPALTVEIITPTRQVLPQNLAANGVVSAWQEAIISPEISGLRVVELEADVGDHVRKGQTLAVLARESIENELTQARAALAEAEAAAAEARADGDRARALENNHTLSAQTVAQLLAREQSAQSRVESAKALLASQQLRLRQTIVTAPDDGVISTRVASIGAVSMQGNEMFRMIRHGRLEWRGEYTATQMERIQEGLPVRITSPAGALWNGRVRQVAPILDADSRRGLVYVDITTSVTSDAALMRPGAYVQGSVALGERETLVVPSETVVVSDGYHQVFVVDDKHQVSARKVRIGHLTGNQQEILSGVQPGDHLVASGGAFLADGDTVAIATDATSVTAR